MTGNLSLMTGNLAFLHHLKRGNISGQNDSIIYILTVTKSYLKILREYQKVIKYKESPSMY